MFFVLGFVPGYVLSWILKQAGLLRVPREVELAGLDHVIHATTQREDDEMRAVLAQEARRPRRAGPAAPIRRRQNEPEIGATVMTGNFTDWDGDIDRSSGRSIPSSDAEVLMVIVLLVVWIGWHIVQIRMENRRCTTMRAHASPGRQPAAAPCRQSTRSSACSRAATDYDRTPAATPAFFF